MRAMWTELHNKDGCLYGCLYCVLFQTIIQIGATVRMHLQFIGHSQMSTMTKQFAEHHPKNRCGTITHHF